MNRLFFKIFPLAFSLLASSLLYAQETKNITVDIDAWLRLTDVANYGEHESIECFKNEIETYRSVLKFDLAGNLDDRAIISEAKLYLYAPEGHTLNDDTRSFLHRNTASWDETLVSGSGYPSYSDKFRTEVEAAEAVDEDYVIDLTTDVIDMHNNPTTNFGYTLKLADEVYNMNDAGLKFASSDYWDSQYWPVLVVTYTIPNMYGRLLDEPDGAFYKAYNRKLCFEYDEKYLDGDQTDLTFTLYDQWHDVFSTGTTESNDVTYGQNWVVWNLSGHNPAVSLSEYYTLEVTNPKGRSRYLRVKFYSVGPGETPYEQQYQTISTVKYNY